MNRRLRIGIVHILLITMILATSFPAVTQAAPVTAGQGLPAEDELELLRNVQQLIDSYHTRVVPGKTLYEGALKGMLDALGDPYSQYLDKAQYERLSSDLEGAYSGIGLTLDLVDSKITVVSVFKSCPADKAGVKAGDVLLVADGKDLRGKVPEDASSILRGPSGTTVTLTIYRPSTGETLPYVLTREVISRPTLELTELGGGLYHLRITQFSSDTGKQFPVVMNYLRMKGLKGLVLDLRDNPGGYLNACISVASQLVPKGPIVELRRKEIKETITSDIDTVPVPTVVLVNRGTASAAEIVAGAIRDRGVGILVGEPTFGKACVQSIVPLGGDLGAIRLTTADYYTPGGYSLAGTGLAPSITAKPDDGGPLAKIVYKRDLTQGMVGLDVQALQTALNFLGLDCGEPDGILGPQTMQAVESFAASHALANTDSKVDSPMIDAVNLAVVSRNRYGLDKPLDTAKSILIHKIEVGYWQ